MEYLNKVELRGIVGAYRTVTINDASITNFNVMTNHAYWSKSGDAVIESTWHNVAFHGIIGKMTKGSKVYVTGRIRNNSYTGADGEERYSNEIVAKSVELIED